MAAGFCAFQIEIRISAEAYFLISKARLLRPDVSARRSRAFGSGLRRTSALASVIDVARLATRRHRRTFRVAVVHQIDHLRVGKGDFFRSADAQLVILILGQNGESACELKGSIHSSGCFNPITPEALIVSN